MRTGAVRIEGARYACRNQKHYSVFTISLFTPRFSPWPGRGSTASRVIRACGSRSCFTTRDILESVVFVCENLAFSGDYTAVLAKHSKNFSLEDSLAIGVDRMQRNFEPMRRQVEEWRSRQISTVAAKLIIYQAFVESELDAPKHLARQVHDLYFRPTHPEFEPRTLWSLTNAFTSAFKELDPMPQFRATANFRLPARRADINRRLPSTTRAHAPAT